MKIQRIKLKYKGKIKICGARVNLDCLKYLRKMFGEHINPDYLSFDVDGIDKENKTLTIKFERVPHKKKRKKK